MATSGGAVHTPPSGPQASQIQTAPNLVGFDPNKVVPSQPILIQRNDQLNVAFLTNGVSMNVRIMYRWLTPQGEIKEGEFITGPFSPSLATSFPLYEGWLLSFAARNTLAPIAGQWCFMQMLISRGPFTSIAVPLDAFIWQGWIYSNSTNGWPGTPPKELTDGAGIIRSIVGTTPAAGADINEVVPSNRRWTLISFRAALTTSATVANRFPGYLLDDGANSFLNIRSNTAQAASLVQVYHITPGSPFYTDTGGDFLLPAPTTLVFKAGFRIKTQTAALQATDQWGAPVYEIVEWGTWDP